MDHSPEIIIDTKTSPIYSSQAECSPIFIKHLIENFKTNKSYDLKQSISFIFELESESLLKKFDFGSSSTFKKGETTNFLTRINGKKGDLFLKSYRKYSSSREPLLIKELFAVGFQNFPKPVGFAGTVNGKKKICFYLQEFISFEKDLGYYFWENSWFILINC